VTVLGRAQVQAGEAFALGFSFSEIAVCESPLLAA